MTVQLARGRTVYLSTAIPSGIFLPLRIITASVIKVTIHQQQLFRADKRVWITLAGYNFTQGRSLKYFASCP